MRSAARDISTGQMTRLDLRRREAVPWYVTAGVLAVCGYAVTMLYQIAEARSGVDALPFWALLTPCVALGIYSFSFFFRRSSIYIDGSQPPVLVTETSWLDRFTFTKKKELASAKWIGARYVFDTLITIEASGSNGEATTIMNIYYSRENIAVSNALCAEIARFLNIECSGYSPFSW
mgnify:CR=1 FL=1